MGFSKLNLIGQKIMFPNIPSGLHFEFEVKKAEFDGDDMILTCTFQYVGKGIEILRQLIDDKAVELKENIDAKRILEEMSSDKMVEHLKDRKGGTDG